MDSEAIKAFKVVLLGEGAVGKTSLMVRYTEGKFSDAHITTVQAAFASKILELDGTMLELAIWDTAGQERFHALGPIYYRDSQGALLVFDISDQKSFNRVKNWVKELRSVLADAVVIFIVGNKSDLEQRRTVSTVEGREYAQSIGAHYEECSAKTSQKVTELFDDLARAMLNKATEDAASSPNEAFGTTTFQRHSGSRRSLRIANDEGTPQSEERRRKCC